MADKPIQERFGEKVIGAFADFARADLDDPDTLEKESFNHVTDASLRRELAQVLYGARWIYKLGLALLTHDEGRFELFVSQAVVEEASRGNAVAAARRMAFLEGSRY